MPDPSRDHVLGVDIGGSGIKAGVVDTTAGVLRGERHRVPTPPGGEPGPVSHVFAQSVAHFDWSGRIGCTFPGVVRAGRTIATAANVDVSWIGVDAPALLTPPAEHPVVMINDADAAGLAEMRFGAGRGVPGLVVMITIGTGLGTALFNDGRLVPNSELGHIEIDGVDAETRASARARKADGLSIGEWALRFDRYLRSVEALLWPELFILGGGTSRKFDQFAHLLTARTPVRAAELRNDAGIVGAAMVAAETDPPD